LTETARLVSLGRIVKVQGLKGEFRVMPHGGESANLERLERVTIAAPAGRRFETAVTAARAKGALVILAVEDVTSVEQAQRLVGGEVLARESDLEPLEGGEFYWYEAAGMEVVADDGRRLGRVESVLATGANDVLQVRDGAREILLPNIPDVILHVDRERRVITVHLLPGLDS
jgi:16S rRNA processing protein RimM